MVWEYHRGSEETKKDRVLLFANHTHRSSGGTRRGGMKRKKIVCFFLSIIRPAPWEVLEGGFVAQKDGVLSVAHHTPRLCGMTNVGGMKHKKIDRFFLPTEKETRRKSTE
jgi:hypothetical protein